MADDDLPRHIGERVRRQRLQRGWTLDVAARRLGVGRRSLVQIEAGEANPSLSTLLALARGFGIALAELLADAEAPPITIRPDNADAPVLWTGPGGGEARLLVASSGLELWQWRLEAGEERLSDAHRPGAREALIVTDGQLTITVGRDAAIVRRGQSAAFAADVDHGYANRSSRAVRFVLAVYEAG